MTTSVRRRRISQFIASGGQPPELRRGSKRLAALAAACVGAAALSAPSIGLAQTARPQVQPTPAADQPAPAPDPASAPPDPATPADHQTAPPGMVRYDHPVMQNGRLILWHGAWRDRVKGKPPVQSAAPVKPQPKTQTVAGAAPQQQPQRPHEFTVLVDPDDSCANRMANEFAAALRDEGLGGRIVAGRVSVGALAAAVQSDSADLALAPLDALIASPQLSASWRERAPYIARLSSEPIEIVASRDIADARQLAGRDVGYGPADSASAASAGVLFSALGVAPRPAYAPLAAELADLSAGKLAAVVAIDGRCAKAIAGFGGDHRFHEVTIPWSPALTTLYAPARLTAKDRPNLIDAEERIDTVAAPRALIALDAAPDTPRAAAAAAVTKSFFDGFDRLLEPDKDAAWRAVNLAATAPWPRLKAAQAWVDDVAPPANPALEAFRSVARSAASASDGPGAQDSDRLFDSLMRWRGTGQ
jgi:TRAP-type uncharacterized transport system substrate-binding protein